MKIMIAETILNHWLVTIDGDEIGEFKSYDIACLMMRSEAFTKAVEQKLLDAEIEVE